MTSTQSVADENRKWLSDGEEMKDKNYKMYEKFKLLAIFADNTIWKKFQFMAYN